MKKQNKTELLKEFKEAIQLYDSGLSSIAGMVTACLNEDELTPWQARSILKCVLSTATHYGMLNDDTLEKTND